MKYSKYSIVIIGSGISGLYAAIKLSEKIKKTDEILIITKSKLPDSNSNYAQGGIVAILPENKSDSVEKHIKDTIKAGSGLSEARVIKFISENSNAVIKDLLNYGVDFDKNEKQEFLFTLEGAHSTKRILHAGGDATGANIEKALVKKILENQNITIYENTLAVELLTDKNNTVRGVISYNTDTKEYEAIYSASIVMASGGLGQVYKYTTNPSVATGDGIALAYRAGAVMSDMEFVQFHPTSLCVNNDNTRFLISEALRGEGAKLVNSDGIPFMKKYDSRADLASRDIVTRSIFSELKQNHEKNVYLDATRIDKTKLLERFPNIFKLCMSKGIDISKQYIPVSPACHYFMGGIKANITNGTTSLKGLYAIGEVSCTGLHGANRLASNSLLECVVSAYNVAQYLPTQNLDISDIIDDSMIEQLKKYSSDNYVEYDIDLLTLKTELQDLMWNLVGVERTELNLIEAIAKIENLQKKFQYTDKCSNIQEYELRNLLCIAKIITVSALLRKESRGGHYRVDYPSQLHEAKHSKIVKSERMSNEFSSK